MRWLLLILVGVPFWASWASRPPQDTGQPYAVNTPADLLPPWLKYPDIPCYSIGWRMGAGEEYMDQWWHFYRQLPPQRREAYHLTYPAPRPWEDFAKRARFSDP